MATVHDVANYILKNKGPISAMKLQKLVYYALAWSLVWDDQPLFDEPIQAWANGPVSPALYQRHKGMFLLTPKPGVEPNLTDDQMDTINKVLEFYGHLSSQQLSDLSHSEQPWRDARRGLADGERGNHVISHRSMADYYESL